MMCKNLLRIFLLISMIILSSTLHASEENKMRTFFTTERAFTFLGSGTFGFLLCFFFCKKSITLSDNAILHIDNANVKNVHFTLYDQSSVLLSQCDLNNVNIADENNEGSNNIIFSTVVNGTIIADNKSSIHF